MDALFYGSLSSMQCQYVHRYMHRYVKIFHVCSVTFCARGLVSSNICANCVFMQMPFADVACGCMDLAEKIGVYLSSWILCAHFATICWHCRDKFFKSNLTASLDLLNCATQLKKGTLKKLKKKTHFYETFKKIFF